MFNSVSQESRYVQICKTKFQFFKNLFWIFQENDFIFCSIRWCFNESSFQSLHTSFLELHGT